MDARYIKKSAFFKIILLQNPDGAPIFFPSTLYRLYEQDYQVYMCKNIGELKVLLGMYTISLIVLDFIYLKPDMKILLKDLPLIVIINSYDLPKFQKIMGGYYLLDYFLAPIDPEFFITRINFLLQQKRENIHLLKKNLSTYLWESKLYQEQKLHNMVWQQDYNHYLLTKSSQFIIFFSNILCVVEDFFNHKHISFEILLKKIIQIISLQMCFFNCYISFNIKNKNYPPNYKENSKHFLLFLVLLGELCKTNNVNMEIVLDFTKTSVDYMVTIEIPSYLTKLMMTYNNMFLDTNNLFHFLQQYLWEHWKKKIYLRVKSDRISVIEVFLQNKKGS